jgi:hypothetical protein
MSDIPSASEALRAAPGATLANGLDTVESDLAANVEERTQLRREVDKAQFRVAAHDLAEGLRGMIRVAPFVSVAAAVALGLLWGRRRRPRRPLPPPMRRG